jgi:putative transposase
MCKRFRKLSHTLYECKYHIVFCPKYRYRILKDGVAVYIEQQIHILSSQKDLVEILELNIQEDHIHLVISIPPKYSVSSFMGFIKGKLALRLFQKYDRLQKQYWGRHLWSRGYCVSTVGLDEDKIRKYVRWQEKRDKQDDDNQLKMF